MNYKTAVHVFYANDSATQNKESRILKKRGVVTPHTMKLDFTGISTDNQLAVTATYTAIVQYKKSEINLVTPTK